MDETNLLSERPGRSRHSGTRARRDIQRPPQTATSDVGALLDRMRTLAAPARVDATWARNFSLEPGSLSVLEWLGVTRAGDVDADAWNQLRLPATRSAALERSIRESYDAIFQQIDVDSASKADLDGAFINTYRMGDPARYVRLFQFLCRMAGIAEAVAEPAQSRRQTPHAEPRELGSRRVQADSQSALAQDRPLPPLGITITIEVPADASDGWIRERIRLIRSIVASET